jgi:hypothetical protein
MIAFNDWNRRPQKKEKSAPLTEIVFEYQFNGCIGCLFLYVVQALLWEVFGIELNQGCCFPIFFNFK